MANPNTCHAKRICHSCGKRYSASNATGTIYCGDPLCAPPVKFCECENPWLEDGDHCVKCSRDLPRVAA